MATDLFNNSSNDYVYPALSPCAGAADDKYIEFIKDGIGVVSGNNILSSLDFSSIKIPVSSYSNEIKIIREGEVVYIPGLTKGLVARTQGYSVPTLVSTDEDLNVYFFNIDLSVSYYKNFSYTYSNIEASANYSNNVSVVDSLNIELDSLGIKIGASYDASAFSFVGTQDGYDFSITNVRLSIVDTSENSSSSFAHLANNDTYNLVLDQDMDVPFAKYPNGAMQGIIMKGVYPSTSGSCSDGEGSPNNYLYINHSKDPVVSYETVSIIVDTEVSTGIRVSFDPSTDTGTRPSINVALYNFSIPALDISALFDVSVNVNGQIIDASIVSYHNLTNCSISDSSISYSNLYDSSVLNGTNINLSYTNNTKIKNSDVINSSAVSSKFTDSSLSYSRIITSDVSLSRTTDSSVQSSRIYLGSIERSSIKSSLIIDSSISGGKSSLYDVSLYYTTTTDGNINASYTEGSKFKRLASFDSQINGGLISDSSIAGNSILNNSVDVSSSIVMNSWINTYKMLVSIDPSTFIKTYEYIIDDDTLDASFGRVKVWNSTIYDSSINNAIIYDSSLYSSYVRDSSLIRCTTYNCTADSYVNFENTKDVFIDPSISASFVITQDTSSYYRRIERRLDVGMSGASSDSVMSAGDYLAMVTNTNLWNKFGDMYIWTSSIDCPENPTTGNLVTGFYVYNPHTFDIKIEYMVFI